MQGPSDSVCCQAGSWWSSGWKHFLFLGSRMAYLVKRKRIMSHALRPWSLQKWSCPRGPGPGRGQGERRPSERPFRTRCKWWTLAPSPSRGRPAPPPAHTFCFLTPRPDEFPALCGKFSDLRCPDSGHFICEMEPSHITGIPYRLMAPFMMLPWCDASGPLLLLSLPLGHDFSQCPLAPCLSHGMCRQWAFRDSPLTSVSNTLLSFSVFLSRVLCSA